MKNRVIMAFSFTILVYITGCATITSQQQAILRETVPMCYGEKECEAKWAAARKWILNNASRKIQIYSDDFIETYNPEPRSPGLAARVIKEPAGNDGYAIIATVWCNNIFGCVPKKVDALLDFNNYVNSVTVVDDSAYKDILMRDNYAKPKLGLYLQYLNQKLIVKGVATGSPANKAGIIPQDVIEQFNEQNITGTQQFLNLLGEISFGEKAEIVVRRRGNNIPLTLKLPTREEIQEYAKSDSVPVFRTDQEDIENKLESLNRILKKGLITQEEYNIKKRELLEKY